MPHRSTSRADALTSRPIRTRRIRTRRTRRRWIRSGSAPDRIDSSAVDWLQNRGAKVCKRLSTREKMTRSIACVARRAGVLVGTFKRDSHRGSVSSPARHPAVQRQGRGSERRSEVPRRDAPSEPLIRTRSHRRRAVEAQLMPGPRRMHTLNVPSRHPSDFFLLIHRCTL